MSFSLQKNFTAVGDHGSPQGKPYDPIEHAMKVADVVIEYIHDDKYNKSAGVQEIKQRLVEILGEDFDIDIPAVFQQQYQKTYMDLQWEQEELEDMELLSKQQVLELAIIKGAMREHLAYHLDIHRDGHTAEAE
jgi:hypothetical protein